MATLAFSESSSRNGYIRSGPSEQLSPTERGFTWATAFQNASVVCGEISASPPPPPAGEGHPPEAGIIGIRGVGQRHGQRPDCTGNKPRSSGLIGHAVSPFTTLQRRLQIDLPGQVPQKAARNHILIEVRIL